MAVAIPSTVKRVGKAYVGFKCYHCGATIKRKLYDNDLVNSSHVFCDRDCKWLWAADNVEGKSWSSIYSSMEAPKSCQKRFSVLGLRCDQCPLPDCDWEV